MNRPEELTRAELAVGVYQHGYGVGVGRCNPTNVADKAAVVHVRTYDVPADADNVIGRGDGVARFKAHGRVKAAGGVVNKRTKPNGRILFAVVLPKSA